MFLEISAIQHFSSVNLNRDDANAIKTIQFGGFERQRVSSQCFKRAMRQHHAMGEARGGNQTYRTKYVFDRLCALLELPDKSGKEHKAIADFLTKIGFGDFEVPKKNKKKKGEVEEAPANGDENQQVLKTLVFTFDQEMVLAAECLREHGFEVKPAADAFKDKRKEMPFALDVALFGRMAASDPSMNVDAATQVAHAISTNEITVEDDFFTAVDDLGSGDRQGANMIGVTQVASPCFYRYACLSLDILKKNLGSAWDADRDRAIAGFIESFVLAAPTGKANSTAPHSVPDFVLVSVGDAQPVSLVNAFDRPVYPDAGRGLGQASIDGLLRYLERVDGFYDWKGRRKAYYGSTLDVDAETAKKTGLEHAGGFRALIDSAVAECRQVSP